MQILEMKKRVFENAVKKHAKRLGLGYVPRVSITNEPCPFATSEIAHIHLDGLVICVWRKSLESLNLDEINSVAAHEVAHIASATHDGKHADVQAGLEIASWSSSTGGIVIDGSQKTTPQKKSKKRETSKKVCSHHDCNIRIDLLVCKFCGKLFCNTHIQPNLPRSPPFDTKGLGGRINMEEWRKNGHGCPPFYDYLKNMRKEEIEKLWKALNALNKGPTMPMSAQKISSWTARAGVNQTDTKISTSHSKRPTTVKKHGKKIGGYLLVLIVTIFLLILGIIFNFILK